VVIHLYPNPARDQVMIQSNTAAVVEVVDLSGKVMLRQALIEGENTLNVSSLSAGVYLCQYQINGKRHATDKLILQK